MFTKSLMAAVFCVLSPLPLLNSLLGQTEAPNTLAQFSRLCRDHHDGPDNSL